MNSPRTVEAMRILGLETSELVPISMEEIKQYFIQREKTTDFPKELIDLRFQMLDNRRHNKKRLIVEKRNDLIME